MLTEEQIKEIRVKYLTIEITDPSVDIGSSRMDLAIREALELNDKEHRQELYDSGYASQAMLYSQASNLSEDKDPPDMSQPCPECEKLKETYKIESKKEYATVKMLSNSLREQDEQIKMLTKALCQAVKKWV